MASPEQKRGGSVEAIPVAHASRFLELAYA
jgi:hypothetical protein